MITIERGEHKAGTTSLVVLVVIAGRVWEINVKRKDTQTNMYAKTIAPQTQPDVSEILECAGDSLPDVLRRMRHSIIAWYDRQIDQQGSDSGGDKWKDGEWEARKR